MIQKDGGAEGRSTASSKASPAESALSRACQNQLVVGTMMLGDTTCQHRQRGINLVLRAVKLWHESQAVALRSTMASLEWSTAQVGGGFLESLSDIMASIQKQDGLSWVGIQLPQLAEGGMSDSYHEVQVAEQDFLCNGMAVLACYTVSFRLQRRMVFLDAWSHRSVLWLSTDTLEVNKEIQAFQKSYLLLEEPKGNPGRLPGLAKLNS